MQMITYILSDSLRTPRFARAEENGGTADENRGGLERSRDVQRRGSKEGQLLLSNFG